MHITESDSDENIAGLVQQGNKDAFGILIDRYDKKITRYANKFLYNYQDREDAVQDVFIKAYKNIQSFRTSERFSPWIYRIAHNTFINVVRKQSKEKVTLFDTDTIFGLAIADPAMEDVHEQKQDRELLEHCLDKLSTKYREVLVLFYFEEKDYEEIASILQIPKATVGVRLARGRERMKHVYNNVTN
ncbi:RNA polymerase sigma factor [Candidatus Kaiserbacteria bacterium]|nr:MAG: RNA polymerase sigma factor [Candidatus Kaiserbacteria bacterium]